MAEQITFTTNLPLVFEGQEGKQLAEAGQVYSWDAGAAAFVPADNLERLVTHEVSAGSFELVFHSDGSVVWD
jgi:hypothetical protein